MTTSTPSHLAQSLDLREHVQVSARVSRCGDGGQTRPGLSCHQTRGGSTKILRVTAQHQAGCHKTLTCPQADTLTESNITTINNIKLSK